MSKLENNIKHFFTFDDELEIFLKKAAALDNSAKKAEELACFVSDSIEYEASDVPEEIDELPGMIFSMERKQYCETAKNICNRLLAERTGEYTAYLQSYAGAHHSQSEIQDACMLKLIELAVIFNSASDYMVKAVAALVHVNKESTDDICNEFEQQMFREYIKCSKALLKEYKKLTSTRNI